MIKRYDTHSFIEKAKEVHGDKYDYSKTVYVRGKVKLIFICPEHGEFEQISYDHLRGWGCRKCSKNRKLTKEDFIAKAQAIHGDKYTYEKLNYINTDHKVIISCPQHGDFEQRADNHLKGIGCPKCAGTYNYDTEEFIRKSKLVHGDKYDYSKVNYKNATTKVTIVCPKHGEFKQQPFSHSSCKHGCPKCGEEKALQSVERINLLRRKQS